VKEGKGKKERYVPLADILIRGLKSYLDSHKDTCLPAGRFT
jgi:site-specific recombinase XerD